MSIGNHPQLGLQQDGVRHLRHQRSSGTWPRQKPVPLPRTGKHNCA